MRSKLNLSVDRAVSDEARALNLNMSRIAEEALAQAIKVERNRLWAEQNRAALETYAREVEADGPLLTRFRSF